MQGYCNAWRRQEAHCGTARAPVLQRTNYHGRAAPFLHLAPAVRLVIVIAACGSGFRAFGVPAARRFAATGEVQMPATALPATTGLGCVPGFLGLAGLAVVVGR